ncbi:MAG TPA: nucleotidyltransferase family protein [Proteobacteria bacterium]|nr:nucleotidyltransferase family protein [Pseudomonadota bacterium]
MTQPTLPRQIKITALVLAAGEARRFGQAKQLLPWGAGETILSHVLRQLSETPGIDTINVILGARLTEIRKQLKLALQTVNIIPNPTWQEGMFSSIRAGLDYCAGQNPAPADGILVLLGDMPFVSSALLKKFIGAATREGSTPVIATENGRPAHPYLLRARHIGEILSLSGEFGIRPFIQKHFAEAVKIAVDNQAGRRDIDTWESYFTLRPSDSAAVISTYHPVTPPE